MTRKFKFTDISIPKKIITSILALILIMLVVPALAMNLATGDSAMGIAFILFFAVNPLLSIVIGVIAATEIRKLWWLPLLPAVTFPLFFSIVIREFVPDLYLYSVIYLPIGLLAMLITLVILRKVN